MSRTRAGFAAAIFACSCSALPGSAPIVAPPGPLPADLTEPMRWDPPQPLDPTTCESFATCGAVLKSATPGTWFPAPLDAYLAAWVERCEARTRWWSEESAARDQRWRDALATQRSRADLAEAALDPGDDVPWWAWLAGGAAAGAAGALILVAAAGGVQ